MEKQLLPQAGALYLVSHSSQPLYKKKPQPFWQCTLANINMLLAQDNRNGDGANLHLSTSRSISPSLDVKKD